MYVFALRKKAQKSSAIKRGRKVLEERIQRIGLQTDSKADLTIKRASSEYAEHPW